MLASIAIFAHNEERTIRRCIDSVLTSSGYFERMRVFVLANGCTDRTVDTVRDITNSAPIVRLVDIPLGDKCNAWNIYVHELAPCDTDIFFFMDGDCWCPANTLESMACEVAHHPHASAIAGVPLSGVMHQLELDNDGSLAKIQP